MQGTLIEADPLINSMSHKTQQAHTEILYGMGKSFTTLLKFFSERI